MSADLATVFPTQAIHAVLVERALTREEARALMRVPKYVFDREVGLGRLRVKRLGPHSYVVPPNAVRDWLDVGRITK